MNSNEKNNRGGSPVGVGQKEIGNLRSEIASRRISHVQQSSVGEDELFNAPITFWPRRTFKFAKLGRECSISGHPLLSERISAVWSADDVHLDCLEGDGDEARLMSKFRLLAIGAARRRGFSGNDEGALRFWLEAIRGYASGDPSLQRHFLQDATRVEPLRRFVIDEEGSSGTTKEDPWARVPGEQRLVNVCSISAKYCEDCEDQEEARQSLPEEQRVSSSQYHRRWEDIELVLEGDHHIRIIRDGRDEKLSYREIPGFEDRRTSKPRNLWGLLQVFGRNGSIPDDVRFGEDWLRIQKQIERLNKVLREFFDLPGDAFPYQRQKGYVPRFKKITRVD